MRILIVLTIMAVWAFTYAETRDTSSEYAGEDDTKEEANSNTFPYNYKGFPHNFKYVDAKAASEALRAAAASRKIIPGQIPYPAMYFLYPRMRPIPVPVLKPATDVKNPKNPLPKGFPYNYQGFPYNYGGFPFNNQKAVSGPKAPEAVSMKGFPFQYLGYPFNYYTGQAKQGETQASSPVDAKEPKNVKEDASYQGNNVSDNEDRVGDNEGYGEDQMYVYVYRRGDDTKSADSKEEGQDQREHYAPVEETTKCEKDGYFYHGPKTVLFCSNGYAIVHSCAPGTENSGKQIRGKGHEHYSAFCDVNKNSDEFTRIFDVEDQQDSTKHAPKQMPSRGH